MLSERLKKKAKLERISRSGGKLGLAGAKIIPLIKRENVDEFLDYILEHDRDLRKRVNKNPEYRGILREEISGALKEYSGIIYGAKVIDSWDRVTSAAGLTADAVGPFSGGAGNVLSGLEEIPELIPKIIYAINYIKKTGDKTAIPLWTIAEAASFIPYIGDAIDMTNIYIGRARKATREKAVDRFKERISGLEKKISQKDDDLEMVA